MFNPPSLKLYPSLGSKPLVFAPANGFAPLVYRQFLDLLAPHFKIYLVEYRPFWGEPLPPKNFKWQILADDLTSQIQQLEKITKMPVTLLGHSLGAVLGIMVAAKNPLFFERVIAVEPVLLPTLQAWALQFLPNKFKRKIPLIRKTLGRPSQFKNVEKAFEFHRRKSVFASFSDQALQDYIEFGFSDSQPCKLLFDKHWEAEIFANLPNIWRQIKAIQTPVFAIRAENSNALCVKKWQRWQRCCPNHEFVEVAKTDHLLPLANPSLFSCFLC